MKEERRKEKQIESSWKDKQDTDKYLLEQKAINLEAECKFEEAIEIYEYLVENEEKEPWYKNKEDRIGYLIDKIEELKHVDKDELEKDFLEELNEVDNLEKNNKFREALELYRKILPSVVSRKGGNVALERIEYLNKKILEKDEQDLLKLENLLKERGGKCLEKDYKKHLFTNVPYKWRCKKGHKWEESVDNILEGSWCPKCEEK